MEPLYIVGRNVNWCSHYGKEYGVSSKNQNSTTTQYSNSTLGYISKENENTNSKTYPHPNSLVPFSLVAQLCPTLCNPMHCNTPGFPVHHQLPRFTKTHIHQVGDAIQPSHPLSSPSPPALNLSQHQGLFK